MFKLRDYQENNATILTDKLNTYGFFFFGGEMRTGKTLTALQIGTNLNCNKVLFITKLKAINSILSDYNKLGGTFVLDCINYQSLHKINAYDYDLIVLDESQRISSFPKPSKECKIVKNLISKNKKAKILFMSGTFCPESYSQLFHQCYVLGIKNPFKIGTFYKWHKVYGIHKQIRIGGFMVNDYKQTDTDKVLSIFTKFLHTFTQKQAGFNTSVVEVIHTVPMKDETYSLIRRLAANKVIKGKDEVLLADTGVKLQSKMHQMFSGTVKFESGATMVLDYSKAEYILKRFKGKKIAILYKFIAERDALLKTFGNIVTDDIEEFNTTDKNFIGQVVSNREGVNLSAADELVMYNIDFSATSYWQGKERLSSLERTETTLHWIFSKNGIEKKILKAVQDKKTYTSTLFKKDLLHLLK